MSGNECSKVDKRCLGRNRQTQKSAFLSKMMPTGDPTLLNMSAKNDAKIDVKQTLKNDARSLQKNMEFRPPIDATSLRNQSNFGTYESLCFEKSPM